MSSYKFHRDAIEKGFQEGTIKVGKCLNHLHIHNGQEVLQFHKLVGEPLCFHCSTISEQLQEIEIHKQYEKNLPRK